MTGKVMVSRRALEARVRRSMLRDEGWILRKARSEAARFECGDYFAVDGQYNVIVAKDLQLDDYAAEHGLLKPYEALEPLDD